ncbi:MAG: hypothetical protein ABSB87_13725 [Terriglobales bacterium]
MARIAKMKEDTSAIQTLWSYLFPELTVADSRQCQVWLRIYTFEQISNGLEAANYKLHRREDDPHPMDREQVIRYASGAMKGLKLAGAQ